MLFQVTKIEFDFEMEDDKFPSKNYQKQLTAERSDWFNLGNDEDYLIEELTCAHGWCIRSWEAMDDEDDLIKKLIC